jgi:YesN/AraC family two-component response regulator
LSEIDEENFEKRHISVDMFKQLIYELRGTLIQFFMQTEYTSSMEDTLSDIDAIKTLEETWNALKDTFKKQCTYIDAQKKSHNVELKDQIIEYITQAYKSPNLSRYDVAAKFGLTEGYLSHFFKEQTGENFSTYLENMRIEQACKLLNDTALTIQEISEQVGYNSVYSFRRAFKRVKGVSPSGLRE